MKNKQIIVSVAVSNRLKTEIKKAADSQNRTMSQWIRILIEKELRKQANQ